MRILSKIVSCTSTYVTAKTRGTYLTEVKPGIVHGANIRPQLQCTGSHEPGVDGADRDRPGGHAGPAAALAVGDAAGPAPGPAGALQPQASRAGAGAAVPVLPHHGGEVELRRHSAHAHLHELPRADLDQRAAAGAGAAELGHGAIDPVDQGARPARLCLTSTTRFT